MVDQEEIVERRREIVRHWWHMKTAVPMILDRLAFHDEYAFLDPTLSYKAKCKVIVEDIECIKKDIRASINVAEIDAQEAHAEYIANSEYLLGQALQQGNLELAQRFNKDVARAKGVQTEEPIVVKGDFFSIMVDNSRRAREKVEGEAQKAIDVTPREEHEGVAIPPVQREDDEEVPSPELGNKERSNKMPAFAILNKKPILQ